jgi:glucosamine--fructose-6-phosphate aminotransferase (isomerizing)
MCGIVGYIGNKDIKQKLLYGLGELEYRGYDSAGIVVIEDTKTSIYKSVGKLQGLIDKSSEFESKAFGVGIGHTRWATHGKPTEENAHPHLGENSFVVHNGIIENYMEIKEGLQKDGVHFKSQTDTEVIVHLFEKLLKQSKNHLEAFTKTLGELKGAFALLLVNKDRPESIYFAKEGSPLILGRGKDGVYFGSSDAALIGNASEVIYLEDGDYGVLSSEKMEFFRNGSSINPAFKPLTLNRQSAQKEGYRYFMEKEIYEQHTILADTVMGRVVGEKIFFEELEEEFLEGIDEIKICACGTSYHAALAGSYLLERHAKLSTKVEIASEFRYKEPIMKKNELFIVISQSGETADTLEALKMAKNAGLKTLAICNVDNSSIVRLADRTVLTRAGIEKGVASTKAFATQMMVLWMLSLFFAQKQRAGFIKDEIQNIYEAIKITQLSDRLHQKLKRLSKRYLHGHGFFFIGRDIFYPLALEGALKLKEISYLHAEGYPSGEMKHGPIALADSELFTIGLLPKNLLHEKSKSNLEELSARDATILAITPIDLEIADDFIKTTDSDSYMVEFFEMMVIVQVLALEISIRLGNDVDMPRNLAKSVTVE